MTAPYKRTKAQKQHDFVAARAFEEQVGEWLGEYKVSHLDRPDKLDWWVPGVYVEVKEKNQRLTERWHLLPGVREPDLFIIDELSVRRAAEHFPHAYFVLHDRPSGRLFLARVDEIFCAERARRMRDGKGKWVIDLRNFRELERGSDLLQAILEDQVALGWKKSECITQLKVEQI